MDEPDVSLNYMYSPDLPVGYTQTCSLRILEIHGREILQYQDVRGQWTDVPVVFQKDLDS
jgi:hypothetical protein